MPGFNVDGVNEIAAGAQLRRGTSVHQVRGLEHVVTAGTGVPTSGLGLGVAR